MTATVQIHEMTALATGFDKTGNTVRFKSADNTTYDTNDRLQIPSGADDFSYTKQLRFYFSVGPSVDIQNLRAYSDGSNDFGTGISVDYDNQGNTWAANTDADISGSDLFAAVATTPIDLDVTNTGPHTGTGYQGDLFRLQMGISNTASPGTLSAETITFAYDET